MRCKGGRARAVLNKRIVSSWLWHSAMMRRRRRSTTAATQKRKRSGSASASPSTPAPSQPAYGGMLTLFLILQCTHRAVEADAVVPLFFLRRTLE